MRFLVQRVNSASVTNVETSEVVGKISGGLFVLVGIGKNDTKDIADRLVKKLLNLRVLADSQKKMNLSILDTKQELLIVSQFTLYANTQGGNRPSFIEAAEPKLANEIYKYLVDELNKEARVETGSFGAYMKIAADLDGPVTILLEE